MLRLGVTGFPLTYTKSPAIHGGFMRAARVKGSYEVFPFDPRLGKKRFFDFLDRLSAEGLRGLNVTIPLKEWAFEYCERRGGGVASGFDGRCARLVRAANTIIFSRGGARAANTDAVGLWDELSDWLGANVLRGADLILVGTGGAARGAIAGVLASHPATRSLATVAVRGRSVAKSRALTKMLGRHGRGGGRGERERAVIVVWCVPPLSKIQSKKLWTELGTLIGARKTWLYDLNYGARSQPTEGLVPASRRRSGLGMLRRQARASFALWHS